MAASAIPEVVIPQSPTENILPTEPAEAAGETDFASIADSGFGETPDEPAQAPSQGAAEQPAATPSAPPTEAVVSAPVQPKVETPPSTPAVAPPVTQSEPVVAAQPVAAPQVPATPAAPAAMSEAEMKAARTKLVDDISTNYRLSEDDKVAIATDPDKVLPRIAGSLFVDVLEATTRVVAQQIPAMIQQHLNAQNVALERRKAFFGKFPALDKPEHIPVLQQVTASYQALNPKVPYEQAVDAIGKLAHALLNIPLTSEGTVSTPAAASPPARPASPLQPGSAARAAAPAGASNIFSELATFELVDE